jgi:hypothetical protein
VGSSATARISPPFVSPTRGAQAVGGKLYVLGGGWTNLLVPELPGRPQAPFAVALGITVPYNLTNRRFTLALELADSDSNRVGDVFIAEFEQGRPPGLRPGATQSILIGINAHPEFPAPGRYNFSASIDGEPLKSVAFEVLAQAPPVA